MIIYAFLIIQDCTLPSGKAEARRSGIFAFAELNDAEPELDPLELEEPEICSQDKAGEKSQVSKILRKRFFQLFYQEDTINN